MSIDPTSEIYTSKPFVQGDKVLCGGFVEHWDGETKDVKSALQNTQSGERILIGKMAQLEVEDAIRVLQNSVNAWDNGNGLWPRMCMHDRIEAMKQFVSYLTQRRETIINILMWEICKPLKEASDEFDRTITFITNTIDAIYTLDQQEYHEIIASNTKALFRRGPLGVLFCLGPFNYPFNETYTSLIPALLMGNVVLMKIPNVGGLAHIETMDAFASCFPAGVVNFISGSGKKIVKALVQTGTIDAISFIGSSRVADEIIHAHPQAHRLKYFLSLEGKNVGLVFPDANLENAVEECIRGSTTFSGQRCTAIKLILIQNSLAHVFVSAFRSGINRLKCGIPWDADVTITPLSQPGKIDYLQSLLLDAQDKGAGIVNEIEGGGTVQGSLMIPAILFPVNSSMRIWNEEQFGPVIPIAVYEDINEIIDYLKHMPYGLQISLFTGNGTSVSSLVDLLASSVGRININMQCSRSPDILPFSGRRSSANGTLSITESLKTFSVETVVATKCNEENNRILDDITRQSNFLAKL